LNNVDHFIREAIDDLIEDFELYPDKYLTEDDVRCFLVQNLMKYQEFSQLQNTFDDSQSISLHTEVRWYGREGDLNLRSDIVFIDVESLRVNEGKFKLPSKQYAFYNQFAIIEIKLRRYKRVSDNKFVNEINKDFEKLDKINKKVSGDYSSYLIALDKRNYIEEIQSKIENPYGFDFFYKFSNHTIQTDNNLQSKEED